jgi:chromosome segregation ATPase
MKGPADSEVSLRILSQRAGTDVAASERACISLIRGEHSKATNNRSTKRPSAGVVVARELDQLKKKVKELSLKLEREAKARKLDAQQAVEARKARAQLTKELTALREHGRKLASRLKSTLGAASKREQALKAARGKLVELREELGRKTADLRRKSAELKKLAGESARRAAAIIRGDAQRAAEPAEPAAPAAPLEPGSESHQNDKPTRT